MINRKKREGREERKGREEREGREGREERDERERRRNFTDLLESGYLLLVCVNLCSEFLVHLLHLSQGSLPALLQDMYRSIQLTILSLQVKKLGLGGAV